MSSTVLISGAGGSLGGALVEHFLKHGHHVHAVYHRTHESLQHDNLTKHKVDLTSESESEDLIHNIRGNIDILVCAAGGFAPGGLDETGEAELMKQYRMNFLTAYNLVKPVYRRMKAAGKGKIFLIGSRQGYDAAKSTQSLAYGLSKSSLFFLGQVLNQDGEGKVITTLIVPSTIDTEANRKAMPDSDFSRWVSPGSIARAIHFYSSDEARDIREPVVKIYGDS